MTPRPSDIEFLDITKHYADVRALAGVSLHVKEGELITLLGASGSGKSTLLGILAGFVEPTSGRVLLGGRDVTRIPPHRRGLGMVFQNYALFPHMTIADNVAFPLRRRRVPKAEIGDRVRRALDRVRLGAHGHRFPSELSGGQQQRAAVARAIGYEPPVLLMDEPLGALDRKLRDELQQEIKALHQELGITFLYVTHDQDEALTLSDRIVLLREGGIEQIGTPRELYERPQTLYAARFLGDSGVLHGTYDGGFTAADGVRLRTPGAPGVSGPACLVLRPEHVTFADGGDGANTVEGTVTAAAYLGSFSRYEVTTASGDVLCVKAEGDGARLVGDRARVTWRPGDGVVLPGPR